MKDAGDTRHVLLQPELIRSRRHIEGRARAAAFGRLNDIVCSGETSLRSAFWPLAAIMVAGAFFWTATSVDVYNATSPESLASTLLGTTTPNVPHPWWLSLHIWVRKAYSIVAFGVVGYATNRALAPTRAPRARAALIVALYSAAIEVAQHAVDPDEVMAERITDVVCGAIGGWIGVAAAAVLRRRTRRKDKMLLR